MTLRHEKWYPSVGGLIAGAGFFFLQRRLGWSIPATMPNLFSSVINVCAIAIGFLGTSQSILVSMEDRQIMLQLRDSGMLDRIVGYLMRGIAWSFCLAALSALMTLADWSALATRAAASRGWIVPSLVSVWVFLLFAASLAYYRIIALFGKILKLGSEGAKD